MAFCSATAKLFYHNLVKYNLLKITSVKNQPNFSCAAHYSDQLSNFRIIPDYLKVADFIEEIVP